MSTSRLRSTLALALALPFACGATCSRRPDPRERDQAAIHYDLGVQAMQTRDARTALAEYQKAVELDPDLDLAHHALGLVYHLSFGRLDEAIAHYRKAIEINPKFSEAYTNLANVYLAQGRWGEATELYEKALSDILYKTPYIAENNLGWCKYKKGEVSAGVDHIRSALVVNPRFCLGYRNLGLIYAETGQPEKSVESFGRYAKYCPDSADAHHRLGTALLKISDEAGARRELKTCVEKGGEELVAEECQKLLGLLDPS
jgi:Tfp pilus assembly protein PilF